MLEPMNQSTAPLSPLDVRYEQVDAAALLHGDDVLAVIGFGSRFAAPDDPRVVRVVLEPLSEPVVEVWRSASRVRSGREGALRWSSDGEYLFLAIEVDEIGDDIGAAAESAYAQLIAFAEASDTPHFLRLWNYLDAINLGDGDEERYRRFCEGRARGMVDFHDASYPAATAIGGHGDARRLLVYGIAARNNGASIENPRQVSAWRYPREYGRIAPTFARAMRTDADQLLISGTAAVVGHASRHEDDLSAQLHETFANLDSLVAATHGTFGERALLKAYVRDRAQADAVAHAIAMHAPHASGVLLLAGDICRRELLVEIDGVQALAR